MGDPVVPLQSRVYEPKSTSHLVLSDGDTFDIPCLRVDDAFKNWVNASWPGISPAWDGTLSGSTSNYHWIFFSAGNVNIHTSFGSVLTAIDQFTIAITDLTSAPLKSSYFIPNGTIGIFGGYFYLGGDNPSPPLDPIIYKSGPHSLSIRRCDLVNPPTKLRFQTQTIFGTPDGPIQLLPTLYLWDARPPSKWTYKSFFALYDIDLQVIQTGTDAFALMGLTHDGDPMGYAEFDKDDVPDCPPSCLGTYQRGNAHGFDGLPPGITWIGDGVAFVNELSIIGQ